MFNYFLILFSFILYLFICFLFCLILSFITYIINITRRLSTRNIAYECGFKAFSFSYGSFDVQFYRVGILFLLFDIEIIILFPWAINFYQIIYISHLCVLLFILLLFLGLVYEICRGVLLWSTQ